MRDIAAVFLYTAKTAFGFGFFVFLIILIMASVSENRRGCIIVYGIFVVLWTAGCILVDADNGIQSGTLTMIITGYIFLAPSLYFMKKSSNETDKTNDL